MDEKSIRVLFLCEQYIGKAYLDDAARIPAQNTIRDGVDN